MPSDDAGARHIERVLHLRKLDYIGTLPAPDLALVAEYARERFFSKGSLLLRESEPVAAVYLVIAGRVHLTRHGRDLGCVGPGGGLGGLAVLAGDEEGLDALAEADSLTLELDADAVLEVLEERFSVFHHVLRETCRRLVERMKTEGVRAPLRPPRAPVAPSDRSLDLIERIRWLRSARPFRRSSINSLAELSRSLSEARYPRGATLWREGDASGTALLIVDGVVECASAQGLRFEAGPEWPLGNIESVAELPRWHDAVALTPVLALQGRSEELIDVFEDNFRMGMAFLASVAHELLRLFEEDGACGDATLRQYYGCGRAEDEPAAPADGTRPATAPGPALFI